MKPAMLLAFFLSIFLTVNTVYATGEDTSVTEGSMAFCTEQAELAGVEDPDEKKQFIKDCMLSYGEQYNDS